MNQDQTFEVMYRLTILAAENRKNHNSKSKRRRQLAQKLDELLSSATAALLEEKLNTQTFKHMLLAILEVRTELYPHLYNAREP